MITSPTQQQRPNDNQISSFRDEHYFLSNFFESPVVFEDTFYRTSEHAYQAAKAELEEAAETIRHASTPREARKLGQLCELRSDWSDVKLGIMEDILRSKFSLPQLREKLLSTAPKELIEGNTWGDRYWGAEKEGDTWVGENHLGNLLMKLRSEFLQESD